MVLELTLEFLQRARKLAQNLLGSDSDLSTSRLPTLPDISSDLFHHASSSEALPLDGLSSQPKRQATAERTLAETSVEAAAMVTADVREMVAAMAAGIAMAIASMTAVGTTMATANNSCVE